MRPTRYTQNMIDEFSRATEPRTMFDFWERNATLFPDKEAIVDSRTRLTWPQANQWIDKLALGLLDVGIQRDELVVIQLPTVVELLLLRLACEKAGILSAAILPRLGKNEIQYILNHFEAVGIVIPRKFKGIPIYETIKELKPQLPQLRHIFMIGDDVPEGTLSIKELAAQPSEQKYPQGYLKGKGYRGAEVSHIALTTGTTGFPKFVEYPAWSRPTLGRSLIQKVKLTAADVVGVFTPVFGGPTTVAYYAGPQVGAKIILQESFEPDEALRLIEKERVTVVCGVDTVLAKMLGSPLWDRYDLSSVRLWYVGGGSIPQIAPQAEKKVGVCVNIYGAADFGGMSFADLDEPLEIRVLAGKPVGGVQFKIVDDEGKELPKGEVGEIWGKGVCCASGYYKDPEATWRVWTKDGWFRTGDLGGIDGQGKLLLVGRKKDMIKRGGQNIYVEEIERMLMGHPKVAAVAIVSMPDPVLTEKACAYVVPKEKFTFDEMVSFLQSKQIAVYKIPERLESVSELPMAAEGQKIDKNVLRQDIKDKIASENKI